MLQALETDRTDGWQAKQQFGEPAGVIRARYAGVFLQSGIDLLAQHANFLNGLETSYIGIEENNGSVTHTDKILARIHLIIIQLIIIVVKKSWPRNVLESRKKK